MYVFFDYIFGFLITLPYLCCFEVNGENAFDQCMWKLNKSGGSKGGQGWGNPVHFTGMCAILCLIN